MLSTRSSCSLVYPDNIRFIVIISNNFLDHWTHGRSITFICIVCAIKLTFTLAREYFTDEIITFTKHNTRRLLRAACRFSESERFGKVPLCRYRERRAHYVGFGSLEIFKVHICIRLSLSNTFKTNDRNSCYVIRSSTLWMLKDRQGHRCSLFHGFSSETKFTSEIGV